MNTDALEKLWKSYLDAYGDISADEREQLLRQSVADDVVSINPAGETQGFDNLVKHIEQFQKQSPGAQFKSNQLIAHHGQLLSEWTLCNKDGLALRTAHTYARFNEHGRLTYLVGFFKV